MYYDLKKHYHELYVGGIYDKEDVEEALQRDKDERAPISYSLAIGKGKKKREIHKTITGLKLEDGNVMLDNESKLEMAQVKADALGLIGPLDIRKIDHNIEYTDRDWMFRYLTERNSFHNWSRGIKLPNKVISLLIKLIFRKELKK